MQKSILENWFNNLNNNGLNKEILILGCNNIDSNFEKGIRDIFANFRDLLFIEKISKFNKDSIKENKNKNILIYTFSNINFNWFDNFKEIDCEFILVQINTLEELTYKSNLSCKFLKNYEPFHMLNDISLMEIDINYFIDNKSNSILKFTQKSINDFLYRGKKNININTIRNDIEYYKSTFILTSRLAIFIYKLCRLEPFASEKEIGEFYAKQFGKSKVFNNKRFSISNTKGYPTEPFIYQNRRNLREQIALKLKERGVSPETIFYATDIDISKLHY